MLGWGEILYWRLRILLFVHIAADGNLRGVFLTDNSTLVGLCEAGFLSVTPPNGVDRLHLFPPGTVFVYTVEDWVWGTR